MFGSHLIRSCSSTQSSLSLSSGEAEHYAVVKAVGVGLGIQQYLKDMGVSLKLRVHSDSSAALGIAKRVGLGTQRHLAVNTLWVQSKLCSKEFELYKVRGEQNPAYIFTKHLCAEKMQKCLALFGATYREGRAESAPRVKENERLVTDDGSWEVEDDDKDEAYNGARDRELLEGDDAVGDLDGEEWEE